jgi:membrane protease YdiL (CAAX protease family)
LFFVEAVLISAEIAVAYATGRETLNKDFMLMMNSLLRDIFVAAFVVAVVAKKYRSKLSDMGLSMQRFGANLRIGFISYLAIIPGFIAVLIVTGIVSKFFSYEPPPQPVVEIYLNENKHPHLLLFTLFVALVGPLIEEIFFRGFAYQAFRTRFGVTRAMLLSAFVFAALHLNLVAFVPIFLLGLALSYLYERTGSLVAPMTVHMLHNFLMVCFTLFYKAYSG